VIAAEIEQKHPDKSECLKETKEVKKMNENTIAGIKANRDHDKVMVDGFEEEIQQLKLKIEYYNGKFDSANNILNELEKDQGE
jgi:hypothetical protein